MELLCVDTLLWTRSKNSKAPREHTYNHGAPRKLSFRLKNNLTILHMEEIWDDSAILNSFHNALSTHSVVKRDTSVVGNEEESREESILETTPTVHLPVPVVKRRKVEKTGNRLSSSGHMARDSNTLSTSILMPPMPPGNEALQTLLKAWFEAGVQTGRFLASQEKD